MLGNGATMHMKNDMTVLSNHVLPYSGDDSVIFGNGMVIPKL